MKQQGKLLALLLALCILLGYVPTVFADALPAAIDENFDTMARGQEPEGWTVEPIGRNDAGVKVVAAPNKAQGDNAMRIEDNSSEYANPTVATKTFAATADVELCFDYYLESVAGANAFALSKDGIATNQKRVNLGVFPNGDGTATLKYYDKTQKKWIATSKTDMQKETLYSFKIVTKAAKSTADVYLNEKKLCSVWADASITKVDRVVFHTNNKASINDVFWIDNVKVIGPATETDAPVAFKDDFSSFDALSLYQTSGTVTLVNEALQLSASSTAVRSVGMVRSGKFGFTATLSKVTGLQFALMNDDAHGIYVAAKEDGTLCYRRDDRWIEFSSSGIIRANEKTEIVMDLPLDRNVDYARVYVNGDYVGMAIYTSKCATVTAMRFEASGTVTIDDVWAGASDGVTQMPERTESQPTVYVPEVIASVSLYRPLDYDPATGEMSIADKEDKVYADTNMNSVGVDLGEKQAINALRLYDSDVSVLSRANHFTLWQSDDNKTWSEIKGFHFNRISEDRRCQVLFEFSGVTARYIKIHTTRTDEEGSIYLADLTTCIRAERRIARQWKMAGTSMAVQNDLSPAQTPMAQVFKQEPTSLTKGDSVGIWFGIHSEVEAIELLGNGLEGLGKDAFTLYYSNDNITYTKIDDVTLSLGDGTYRLTFGSIKCGYLKLHAEADVNITLASLADGVCAYSSCEVLTGHVMRSTDRGADGDFYVMPDGTLVASYNGFASEVGTSGGGDASDSSLDAFTSVDGGYTWSEGESFLIKNPSSLNVLNPTYIWLADGELGLIYIEKEATEVANIYIRRSQDNGITWGEPQRITDAPQGYSITSSGHRVLRLSTGRILLPVGYSATLNDVYGSDRAIGYVWYSDDEGRTWQRSSDALTLPYAALEPSVAELENGNILLSLRTREERVIYQSISTDGGSTWAQPVKIGIQSPSATNTVMRIPATGDVALFWNNDFSTGGTDRRPLTVLLTADDGLTYHNLRSLVDCDYPTPWPSVAFYGRSVLLMHGNETHVRVFDVATLYYTTSGKVTTADLLRAATPTAVFDAESGWLTGLNKTMQYSLDGGVTWTFAGGTSVLLDLERITAAGILIKDIGTAETAPSEVQSVAVAQNEEVTPPADEPSAPSAPSDSTDTQEQNDKKPTIGAGGIAAIVIGSVAAAGAIACAVYYSVTKKSLIKAIFQRKR